MFIIIFISKSEIQIVKLRYKGIRWVYCIFVYVVQRYMNIMMYMCFSHRLLTWVGREKGLLKAGQLIVYTCKWLSNYEEIVVTG